MAIVELQPFLADKIGVEKEITIGVSGDSVDLGNFLDRLFLGNDRFRYSLMTETGSLRPHIGLFIDNRNTRDLKSAVSDNSRVFIVQALSGG